LVEPHSFSPTLDLFPQPRILDELHLEPAITSALVVIIPYPLPATLLAPARGTNLKLSGDPYRLTWPRFGMRNSAADGWPALLARYLQEAR
jgi:hypothetical protein